MFHVKHQNSGLFRGVPIDLGYSLGVEWVFTRTWNAAPRRTRPSATSPKSSNFDGFHRFTSESSGGSDTIITPPTFINCAPHSAVTAGGPNERAVTRSNASTNSGILAISSTLAVMTVPLSGAPSDSSASSRNLARLTIESVNTARHRQRSSRNSPGSPPPLPRSRKASGAVASRSSQQSAKPKEWVKWGSIALGPKKPRALDSSRTRGSQSLLTIKLRRCHHYETPRVIALRSRDDIRILG